METAVHDRVIFISHADYDKPAAIVLKDVLSRAGVGRTFLDADDLHPGDDWQGKLKAALSECDAIVTLLTPQFASRLWMAAEWACFWAAGKPCYTLTLDVSRKEIFAPMNGSQHADLGSVASLRSFLDVVAADNLDNHGLATRAVERIAQARTDQRASNVDELFQQVLFSEEQVSRRVIEELIAAGGVESLLNIHTRADEPQTNLSRDRLFAVAKGLQAAKVPSARLVDLTAAIGNSNYQRDVVIAVLGSAESADERRGFADSQFDELSEVARRRVVRAATDLEFALSPLWDGIEPYGRASA